MKWISYQFLCTVSSFLRLVHFLLICANLFINVVYLNLQTFLNYSLFLILTWYSLILSQIHFARNFLNNLNLLVISQPILLISLFIFIHLLLYITFSLIFDGKLNWWLFWRNCSYQTFILSLQLRLPSTWNACLLLFLAVLAILAIFVAQNQTRILLITSGSHHLIIGAIVVR